MRVKLCVDCDLEEECEKTTNLFQVACEKFIQEVCKGNCCSCKHAITEYRTGCDEEYIAGCKIAERKVSDTYERNN